MLRISQIIKGIDMALDQTTLFNNVIGRGEYLSKQDNTGYMFFNSDIIGLCKALCEELERVYKRIESLEKMAQRK